MTKKLNTHGRIIAALNEALRGLYHNATIRTWADNVPGCMSFWDWLDDAGPREVDYLNAGGPCGLESYATMEHVKRDAEKYASPRARAYYLKLKHRQFLRESAEYIEGRIHNYGTIYAHGRGGRTLAPEAWAPDSWRGFRARQYEADDISSERASETLRDVLAFNAYIASWCACAAESYREECAYRLDETIDEKREEARTARREALALAREIKHARRAFTPAICAALRDKLSELLCERGRATSELFTARATLKGLQA